jgi:predicted metalloprotease
MKWRTGRRSENVDDLRGAGGGRRVGLGGPRIQLGGTGLILLLLASWALGINPLALLGGLEGGPAGSTVDEAPFERPVGAGAAGPEDELADFVSVVLADTEDTWAALFAERGARYEPPRLVLFTDAVRSGCGIGEAAMGPFYCPADGRVYIDLGFYRELRDRFRAPGDFAQAYVIAHEVGHHVQTLLGTSEQVQRARERLSESQGNALSVRLELQADCYAGAHHAHRARNVLEQGDVEEGLGAAAAIGDDRIQKQARGYAQPESFTHGSSEQRVRWFTDGLESGSLEGCDTFAGSGL